jgi:ribosome recycling factor
MNLETEMNQERSQIMEKAKAKRRRREAGKAVSNARKGKTVSSDAATSLTEKIVDIAQGAAAQVGAFVKTAAKKITGAEDNRRTRTSA